MYQSILQCRRFLLVLLLKQNFYEYVNNYRIEEFKRLLLEPKYENIKFLNIAFDVGFNSKSTFNTSFKKFTGKTPSEYKKFKNLKRENLRDHMTDLELIFSMLGEASTTEIACNRDAQGFTGNKQAAKQGGDIAGNARKELEEKSAPQAVHAEDSLPIIVEDEEEDFDEAELMDFSSQLESIPALEPIPQPIPESRPQAEQPSVCRRLLRSSPYRV